MCKHPCWVWLLACNLGWLMLVGCSGSEAPTLSIQATNKSQESPQARIVGTWHGEFVLHNNVDMESFDAATIEACKSMKIRITFRPDGTMSIAATIRLPEIGPQSNETQGRWSLVSHQDNEYVVRTEEGNSEPEEVTLYFRNENMFEMLPPTQLNGLGVMRFVREK